MSNLKAFSLLAVALGSGAWSGRPSAAPIIGRTTVVGIDPRE